MKKVTLLLLVLILGFSCNDDDSNNQKTNQELLINTWFFEKSVIEFTGFEIIADDCTSDNFIRFNTDNTFDEQIYSLTPEGICEDDGQITGTYEILGRVRYDLINEGVNPRNFRIISISEVKLIVQFMGTATLYYYKSN